LCVALLQVLARCREEEYDSVEVAEMGFLLESSELELAGGRQDQYAAALGGFHELVFGAGSGVEIRPMQVTEEAAAELAEHLTIVYTGQSHFSSQTHDRVWASYHENRDGVKEAIHTMRDLVAPARDAINAGNWQALAELIDENWQQQQRLDATISTNATQVIESAVRNAGAWGVKAAGAGAGGCLIVAGPADECETIAAAAEAAGGQVLEWAFDRAGVTSWQAEDDAGHDAG
jgi:D-glycero-alpha-D-manno-heptose-7-phosphate kinase